MRFSKFLKSQYYIMHKFTHGCTLVFVQCSNTLFYFEQIESRCRAVVYDVLKYDLRPTHAHTHTHLTHCVLAIELILKMVLEHFIYEIYDNIIY